MNKIAVDAVLNGLKKAGINFIASLPDSDICDLQKACTADPSFKYVPVTNEEEGVAMCGGAWMGGMRPAVIVATSGFLTSVWPLVSLNMAFGVPLLILIAYRGDIGDPLWWMSAYKYTTEPILKALNIPYKVVGNLDVVSNEIEKAERSTRTWLNPVAIVLTGEVIFE